MRPGRILLLVVPLFLLTLLVRLPAAWVMGLLPQPLRCVAPGGTVWNGWCSQLLVQDVTWNGLRWQLHPLPLLTGTVSADLTSTDSAAPGAAQVRLHGHTVDVQDLRLDLPPALTALLLPAGWSGALALDVDQGSVAAQRLTSLQGSATLQDVRSSRPPLDLGSLRLLVPQQPAGDTLRGSFTDLGNGPLAINGTAVLDSSSGRYEISGTIAARASADDNLRSMLGLLGKADAQGRHGFSLSGSL